MKKKHFFRMLVGAIVTFGTSESVCADTYNPEVVYNKGDQVEVVINGIPVELTYLNDSSSSCFYSSSPYDINNAWLWSVSKDYEGEWVQYHYVFYEDKATLVSYEGHTYQLLQDLWPDASNPLELSMSNWGWKCMDCVESSTTSRFAPNLTSGPSSIIDYFSISKLQENNGFDNTNPINAKGTSDIVYGKGSKFFNLGQLRMCETPVVLYNNDLYLRDSGDSDNGLGYYGKSENGIIPQKRLFADIDINGPILYGWNGGALGIRQRKTISNENQSHLEKIALQWTPSTVYIGSAKLPMILTTYSRFSIQGLTETATGLDVNGTEHIKAISVYDATNKKNSFVVYGNGVVNAKKIYAEEIEVLANVNGKLWPDYVFEKTYSLQSLSSLEDYVKKNKHLPEVPSAKEIEENGVNLAEINAILLKKIEELTLYVIDLQTQITSLKGNDVK